MIGGIFVLLFLVLVVVSRAICVCVFAFGRTREDNVLSRIE